MIENMFLIVAAVFALSSLGAIVAWLGVILFVNPALDPLFNNDKHFEWFLRRAHPFFFSVRAQHYAGAVISKWLAKRTMGLSPEFAFRERVGFVGRLFCWAFIGSELLLVLSTVAVFIFRP